MSFRRADEINRELVVNELCPYLPPQPRPVRGMYEILTRKGEMVSMALAVNARSAIPAWWHAGSGSNACRFSRRCRRDEPHAWNNSSAAETFAASRSYLEWIKQPIKSSS
jgi:hypothetical protein